jgi:hypothetical protein
MVINNQFSSMNSNVRGNSQTSINGKISQNQARATDPRSARTNRQTQQTQPRTPNTETNTETNSITQKAVVRGNGQTINQIG